MFNSATRQSFLQLNSMPYSPGAPVSQQLPQVGFLSRIIVSVSATFTTSGAGTYAAQGDPVPTPFNMVQRIRVVTNEGAELYNTSGWGNYLIQRLLRDSFDPRNPETSYGNTNVSTLCYSVPSTITTSTTYTINFNLIIPIAWQDQLAAGLILLQNPTTRLQLELTLNDITVSGNLVTTTGGTISNPIVTIKPMMEIFNLPAQQSDLPDLSYVHVWLEDSTALTGTGDFIYKPSLGNIYLNTIQEFINAGARVNPGTFFTNLKLSYAQTQQAYNIAPSQQAYLQRLRLGNMDLPDGVWWWAFALGSGLLEQGNTRDVIDTSRLTDLSIISSISGSASITPGSTTFVRTLREMLAPISR